MVLGVARPQTWWPSPFGAGDQLGMLNHITPAKRVQALARVRHGRLYDLGRELHEGIPAFPGRFFRQTLVTTAHHANEREPGDVNWITEQVAATMQLGTHLDALSHLQIGDRGYNGWTVAELADTAGVTRLGIETVPQIVTKGWLVDAPGGTGDEIGLDAVAGIDPEPGDAVLFHTGWGERWDDPGAYLEGEPGPGMALAEWLAERQVALTGCDTWSFGPVPSERPFEVPQTLNAKHGVFIVENLDLAALAGDGVREFCLVLTHPKLRGATGAWTSPIALV